MSVPVVIVSGFLGAGKTTLLKRFLTSPEGLRVALVKNEFTDTQDLSFEEPLLLDERDTEAFQSYLELPNSCVCCSAKTQIEQAVTRLVAKGRDEGRPFDLVLIELSGVSDPSLLAEQMMAASDVEADVLRFAGVICLVDVTALKDAELLRRAMEKEAGDSHGNVSPDELFARQLACADLIVLNKCDLLPAEETDEIEGWLRQITPLADVVKCVQASIKMEDLQSVIVTERRSVVTEIAGSAIHAHQYGNMFRGVDLNSFSFVFDDQHVFDSDLLEVNLNRFLWDLEGGTAQVYRVKGLFKSSTEGQICSLQAVRSSVDISECRNMDSGSVSRFLFVCSGVGKIDLHEVLRRSLRS